MTELFSLKDEAVGRKSRSAFIAMAAFWISAIKFIFSDMTITYHTSTVVQVGKLDAALLGAFLFTCLSLYFGRRYTDALIKLKPGVPGEPAAPAAG